jgi:hypothetical protein
MWRYLVGAGAAALLIVAGMMLQAVRPPSALPLTAMPTAAASTGVAADAQDVTGGVAVPEALPKTREEKRFNRYDKDRNGSITREEYLASRHKAFAKLDKDGNGTLSFDEWAIKTETKFATADKDKSGAMSPAEFATTAVKRKAPRRNNCPPGAAAKAAPAAPDDGKDDEGA